MDKANHKPITFFLRIIFLALAVLFFLSTVMIIWDGLNSTPQPSDIGVVLGNRVQRNGQPGESLQARLDKAIDLYFSDMFPLIIVSGGTGREGLDEAAVMKNYLVSQGIPPDIIHMDSNGYNTYRTAKNSTEYMHHQKMQSAVVISQYFHLTRAKLAFRRFGVAEVSSASANYFHLIRDPYSIIREVFGLYIYILRDY
jgi:vancomycin permeability regulator SanA